MTQKPPQPSRLPPALARQIVVAERVMRRRRLLLARLSR